VKKHRGGRPPFVEASTCKASVSASPSIHSVNNSHEITACQTPLVNVIAESPSKWTEANVSEWLRDEGLGRLVGTFAEHHIDGGVLLTLDGEELRKELDITSLGDRKKVLAAIARLKAKEMEWGARVVQDLDR
jgi:hypothetical protein